MAEKISKKKLGEFRNRPVYVGTPVGRAVREVIEVPARLMDDLIDKGVERIVKSIVKGP